MALATEAVAVVVEGEAPRSSSAVSWAAIVGGALTAAAVTLLLVALGTGIGLSSVSPWSAANPSATTFTLLAAVWLIIVQWLSWLPRLGTRHGSGCRLRHVLDRFWCHLGDQCRHEAGQSTDDGLVEGAAAPQAA